MIKINNNKMDVENISFGYGLVDSPEASIILKSTNMVKVCTKCKVEKVLDRFSKSKFGKFKVASECKECNKIYRESNKEYLKEIIKQWRKKNKESIKEKDKQRSKIYRENNKEKEKKRHKKYQQDNREKINKYERDRIANDSLFKLTRNIRSLIRNSIRDKGYKKNSKTYNILGCSFEKFKLHIESQFENWMSWDNQGKYNGDFNYGWEYDHIIPLSYAKTEKDVLRLNHYLNFQPLCSKINREIKRDKIYY